MTRHSPGQKNLNQDLLRMTVWHFYIPVSIFCFGVTAWIMSKSATLGLGTLSTLFSLLLFAGQMAAKYSVDAGPFLSWGMKEKINFVLALGSALLTATAYAIALPSMFIECAAWAT